MKFTKMHGCGNDYIYIDGAKENIPADKKPELARRLSDRHFGIGGDGVIFINPSEEADFEMEMYNADGSRAEMCGTGIRCVGKYVYDNRLTDKISISVSSAGKMKYLDMTVEDGKVRTVTVDMGEPIFEPKEIPVVSDNEIVMDEPIIVKGQEYRMTCVSVGNPHAVVFVDDVEQMEIPKIGPHFENHERFPKRTNTVFVRVINRSCVELRAWERGAGETLADGTGCCAAVAAGIVNGLVNHKVAVKVLGGEILVDWVKKENKIYMTGTAETVFEGEIDANAIAC